MAEPNTPLVGANLNQSFADSLANLNAPVPTAPVGAQLFSNYAGSLLEQKKQSVQEKAAQKKIQADPATLGTMSPMDRAAAYAAASQEGDQNTLNQIAGYENDQAFLRRINEAERSGMDYTNDVASSLLRGIGNLGSGVSQLALELTPTAALGNLSRAAGWTAGKLGADGVDEALTDAGNWMREPTNAARAKISGWNQSLQDTALEQMSLPSRRDIAQSQAAQQLDEADSRAQMEAAGGGAWEQTKRFGRDVASGLGNMIDNPLAAQDMVIQQFPQLATGGLSRAAAVAEVGSTASAASNLLSKAANAAETAVIKKGGTLAEAQAARLTAERALAGRAQNITREATEKAATRNQVFNIGIQEAGGAADQAGQQVLAMSHEQLMQNSEQYRNYIASGMSQENAKNAVAADAGNIAAAIQLPLAMATGRIAAKFETNPFGVAGDTAKNRLMQGFQNIGREVLEEIPQSTTGQVASNIGVKATGDNKQDVLEGAGNAAAQGFIGALGMSGTVQAPGVIAKPLGDAVTSAVDKTRNVVNDVAEYRRTNNAENRAAASDADKQQADFDEAVATFDPTVGRTDAEQTPNPQASSEQAGDLGTTEPGDIPAADTAGNAVPSLNEHIFDPQSQAIVASLAQTGMNDAQQLHAVSNMLKDNKDMAPAQRRALEIYAADRMGNLLNHFDDVVTPAFQAETDPVKKAALQKQINVLNTLMQSPQTQRFLNAYDENNVTDEEFNATLAALPDNITEENANSPEVQKSLQGIKEMSLYRPLDISVEQYQKVLDHDTSLTPSQRSLLVAKQMLASFVATPDSVRQNIRKESREDFKSAQDHAQETLKAIQLNDRAGIEAGLKRLGDFARIEADRAKAHDATMRKVISTGLATNEYTAVPGYYQLQKNGKKGGAGLTDNQYVNPGDKGKANLTAIMEDTNHLIDVYNSVNAAAPAALAGQSMLHVQPTWQNAVPGGATAEETAAFQQEVQNRAIEKQNATANKADANAKQTQAPVGNANTEVPETSGAPVEPGVQADESGTVVSESRPDAAAKPAERSSTVQPDVVPATYDQPALSEADVRELPADQISDLMTEAQNHIAENGFDKTAQDNFRTLSDEMARREAEPVEEVTKEEPTDTKEVTVDSEKAAPIGQQVLGKVQPNLEIPEGADAAVRSAHTNQLAASMEARPTTRSQYSLGALSEMTIDKLAGLVGNRFKPTAETVDAVKGIQANVARLANAMEKRLQTRLAKKTKNGTIAETFTNGATPAWAFPNHKAMYATAVREDGSRRYVPEFKEAAALAAMNWVMSGEDFIANLDAKRAAAYLNMKEGDVTPADIRRVLEAGVPIPALTRQLASHINSLLGIREKTDASATYGNHITQALAMEALEALKDAGLVNFNMLQRAGNAPATQMVKFAENPDITNLQNMLSGKRDIIMKALLPDAALGGYTLGEPTLPVTLNVNGKTWQKVPAKIRKAIEAQQKMAYKANMQFINMFASLGSQAAIAAGFFDGDITRLNKQHRESVEGKNNGLVQAVKAATELLNAVEAYADANDMRVEDVPIYFSYDVDTNGRMRMNGSFNPQSNKIFREMFMATDREVSRSDQQMMREFFLHIAQGLGVKVDKQPNSVSIVEVNTKLKEPGIQDALAAMNHGLNNNWELDADQVAAITAAVRGKDNKYLHALLSYAKYDDARAKKQDTFNHSLTFEVDGVTDGPANSFVHFGMQGFGANVMKMLRQMGWMVNDPTTPFNAIAKSQRDLYETASDMIGSLLDSSINYYRERDPKTKKYVRPDEVWKAQQPDNVRVLLSTLGLAKMEEDADANISTKFSRAFAKLLVTPATYGSGTESMARTISNEVLSQLYAQLSESIAQESTSNLNPTMLKALDSLSKSKQFTALLNATPEQLMEFEAKNMGEFHKAMFYALKSPIEAGIDAAMGGAPSTNSRVAGMVNLQSILFRDAWQKEYVRLHEQRVAEGAIAPYEMLSIKDENEVTKATQHLAPIFQNGISGNDRETGFNMAEVQQNAEVDYLPKSVQRNSRVTTLDESMSTEASGRNISNAGVRSTALSVIAAGDATMMTVFYNAMERSGILAQNVYDGLDTRIGDMAQASDAINNAVATGWGVNVYENMALELKRAMGNYDWGNASEEALAVAGKILGFENANASVIAARMPGELNYHIKAARMNKATREVLLNTKSSISHMAGYDTPYVHGTKEYTGTPDEVVAAISADINARLAETAPEMKTDEAMDNRLRAASRTETGPYKLTRAELMATLSTYDFGGNKLIRALFTRLAPLLPSNLEVHVGTFAELADVRDRRYPNTMFNPNATASTIGSDIFVYQMSPEVLFHEAIHAALRGAVSSFVTNPESLSADQRAAMTNIQTLMNQFLATTTTNVDEYTLNHVEVARRNIQRYVTEQDMDGALNEFLAWGLSNQGMQNFLSTVTAAKGTGVKSALAELIGKLQRAVLRVLGFPQANGMSALQALAGNVDNLTSTLPEAPSMTSSMSALNQALDHSTILPDHSQRLTDMVQRLEASVGVSVKQTGELLALNAIDRTLVSGDSSKILNAQKAFVAAGWNMAPQEEHAFRLMQAALASGIQLNPTALNAAQRLYDSVMPTLTTADMTQAQLDALKGKGTIFTDGQGRTNQLANFIALGVASDAFRQKLAERDIPRRQKTDGSVFDKMSQMTKDAIDYLADLGNGTRKAANAAQALDVLAEKIGTIQVDTNNDLLQQPTNLLNRLDAAAGGKIKSLGEKAGNLATARRTAGKNVTKQDAAVNAILDVASLLDKDGQGQEALQSALNSGNLWTPVFELITEALGSDKSSVLVNNLLQQAKNKVSAVRQKIREGVPVNIQSKFSRELSADEWTAMTRALGKTDAQSLLNDFSLSDIHSYLKDEKALQAAVTAAESIVAGYPHGADYVVRSKELAHYMMTGENISDHLLRNAEAISLLQGSGKAVTDPEAKAQAIDNLVSLYAMQQLTDAEKAAMDNLFTNEQAGMQFVTNYLWVLNANEKTKLGQYSNTLNAYKGHVPSITIGHKNLVVADAVTGKNLVQNHGYVKLDGYVGDKDLGNNTLSYYYTTESLTAGYTQGALQTVEPVLYGTDPVTGRTVNLRGSFGLPKDAARVMARQKHSRIVNAKLGTEAGKLMPVFDKHGDVVAYEASMPDEVRNEKLGANTNLSELMGVWQGRQAEESLAQRFNEGFANKLAEIWNSEKGNRKGEYIDLAKSAKTNKVHAETWEAIPRAAQDMLKKAFGNDPVMVRKDMLNNAFGYRNFTLSSVFVQQSELPVAMQNGIANLATAILGAKAPRYLRKIGRINQDAVSVAKDWIIVRSVSVFTMNLLGNFVQLGQNGVGLKAIFKGQAAKMQEVDAYLRNINKMNQLHSDNLGSTDPVQIKRNKMAIQRLNDANARMSIAPLIAAGELPTVAEGLSIEDDNALRGGALNWIENITDKMPKGLSDAAKLALIAKGTPLHNGLNRMMTYGDFVAKAVLFDKLTQQDGLSKNEALKVIQEEFINYDNNPGRTRTWFESHGFSWFLTYKLKIQKILLRRMRDNPLSTLVYQGVADGLGIDSPFEANVFGDNFWYSFSDPTRVLDAPSLHPVAQLLR